MEMNNQDFEVLFQIGRGSRNLEIISSNCSMERKEIASIIPHLEKEGLLQTTDPPQLSSHGLSELSKSLVDLISGTSEYVYWSHDGLPFFPYHNSLRKDVFFYPNLFFDPANASLEDDVDVVYAASLLEVDFSIENLHVLSNLLFQNDFFTPIGFWLLKYSRKKVCGWGVSNFEDTMRLIGKPISMTFLFGCNEYVIVITSNRVEKSFSRLKIKIYITRESCAYIDVLDYLRDKLKPFLVFNRIHDFSEGQEIPLEKSEWWKNLPEPGLRIVPKVYGKISYRDIKYKSDPVPLVVVLDPKETKTRLAAVSPWFATCPGGCDEKKLSMGELHRMHSFQVLNLPEIDLVTFMINNAK